MKLIDKKDMSMWAYHQCKNGNDIEEIRNLIVDPVWIYVYCTNIKYDEEMWNKIKKYLRFDTRKSNWYLENVIKNIKVLESIRKRYYNEIVRTK